MRASQALGYCARMPALLDRTGGTHWLACRAAADGQAGAVRHIPKHPGTCCAPAAQASLPRSSSICCIALCEPRPAPPRPPRPPAPLRCVRCAAPTLALACAQGCVWNMLYGCDASPALKVAVVGDSDGCVHILDPRVGVFEGLCMHGCGCGCGCGGGGRVRLLPHVTVNASSLGGRATRCSAVGHNLMCVVAAGSAYADAVHVITDRRSHGYARRSYAL